MPGQVVITERIARKYFKEEDPIGKILIFTGPYYKISCEVTGVMEEMPSNSHIHYNFLISYTSLPKFIHEYWYKHEAYTYVLLDSPEREAEIEREFPVMAEKYKTEEALKNKTWGVDLVPLADIHLTPQLGYEMETKGNRSAMIALVFGSHCHSGYCLDKLYQSDSSPFDGACQGSRSASGSGCFPQAVDSSVPVRSAGYESDCFYIGGRADRADSSVL